MRCLAYDGYKAKGWAEVIDAIYAQVILRSLTGLNIIGGDVVEVSPPLDPTGLTAVHAANLMFEILCLVAEARAP